MVEGIDWEKRDRQMLDYLEEDLIKLLLLIGRTIQWSVRFYHRGDGERECEAERVLTLDIDSPRLIRGGKMETRKTVPLPEPIIERADVMLKFLRGYWDEQKRQEDQKFKSKIASLEREVKFYKSRVQQLKAARVNFGELAFDSGYDVGHKDSYEHYNEEDAPSNYALTQKLAMHLADHCGYFCRQVKDALIVFPGAGAECVSCPLHELYGTIEKMRVAAWDKYRLPGNSDYVEAWKKFRREHIDDDGDVRRSVKVSVGSTSTDYDDDEEIPF